jgi:hypothetical protein
MVDEPRFVREFGGMTTRRQTATSGKARAIALVAIMFVLSALGLIAWFGWSSNSSDSRALGSAPSQRAERVTDPVTAQGDASDDAPTAAPMSSDRRAAEADRSPTTIAPPHAAPLKIRVRGRVLDSVTRTPIKDALIGMDPNPPINTRPILKHVDAKGRFDVEVPTSGAWFLRADGPNHVSAETDLVIGPNAIELEVPDLLLVALHKLVVRLLGPDGRGINAWCIDHPELDGSYYTILRSDEQFGRRWNGDDDAAIGGLQLHGRGDVLPGRAPMSEIMLMLRPPLPSFIGVCHDGKVIASRPFKTEEDIVEFTISTEELVPHRSLVHLKAVDAASGAPIRDARVGLNQAGTYGMGTNETDVGGVARIGDVQPGRYFLTIVARGCEWVQEEAFVGLDADTDLGVFRLAAATSISGQVVDERGPVAGVEVFAFPLDRFEKTRETRKALPVTTNSSGQFMVPALGRGKYLVRIASGDRAGAPTVVDTSAGDVTGVVVHVSSGTEVRLSIDEPLFGMWLSVVDADEMPIDERLLAHEKALALRLVPGKYTWRIDEAGRAIAAREFVVLSRSIEVHVGQ